MVTSTIEAVNLNLAIDTLTANKLKILEIRPVRFSVTGWLDSLRKVNRENLVLCTRRLATMLKSGLKMDRALQVLYEQEDDQKLKSTLQSCVHDIRTGSSLSWAMGKHPEVFSSLYVSMVKVGETTGDMAGLLNKLADFLERDLKVRKQAQAALTYPAFILGVALLVIAGIFTYVLPNLLEVFTGMAGGKLPWPTKVMFFLVTTVRNPYVLLAGGLAIAYYAIYFRDYLKTPAGRYKFDRLKLRVPVLGPLNKKILVAHFCRVMGTLLSTGIPLVRGVEILMEYSENEFFRISILNPIVEEIKQGQTFANAVTNSSFFPDMTCNMIAVGEATGEVSMMLEKISLYYDNEIKYALEGLLSLIEPIMIAGMGLMVCFVLLAVFMPLYQVIMNIGS
jgi:type II secretory pathway component PulF